MANANCDLCYTFHPYTKHAQITAGQLTSFHLGVRLRITEPMGGGYASVYQGQLAGVEHGASKVAETALGSGVTAWALGQRWVRVSLLADMHAQISTQATVELLG